MMAYSKRLKERNWTDDETTLLCEILADPNSNFVCVLESRAVKKAPTRDIFADILNIFMAELKKKTFVDINLKNFSEKKHFTPLNTDVRKLQAKYNNIKTKWREFSNRLAKGIGPLTQERWYQIMDPLFAERKGRHRTTLTGFGPDDIDVKSNVYVSVEWNEDETPTQSYDDIRQKQHIAQQYNHNNVLAYTNDDDSHHTTNDTFTINSAFQTLGDALHVERIEVNDKDPSPQINGSTHRTNVNDNIDSRSHTDALYQLASSINKLADVNAKRLKLEYEDRDAQLKFKHKEAEANRKHELEMAELSNCCRSRVFPNYVTSLSHRCSSAPSACSGSRMRYEKEEPFSRETRGSMTSFRESRDLLTSSKETRESSTSTEYANKSCQASGEQDTSEKSTKGSSLDVHI